MTMKLSDLARTIHDRVLSGERNQRSLHREAVTFVHENGLTDSVVAAWVHKLVHDEVANIVQKAGRLPRAVHLSEQGVFPWGLLPVDDFIVSAERYIQRYAPAIARAGNLQRCVELIKPWAAEHPHDGMTAVRAAEAAGVAAEDIAALTDVRAA